MYQPGIGKTAILNQFVGKPVYYPANQNPIYQASQPIYYGPIYLASQPIIQAPVYHDSQSDKNTPKWEIKNIDILPDDQYAHIGYKIIGKDFEYIAKLGIPKNALTNIYRPGIDNIKYAKFRANIVHVLDIYEIGTGKKINKEFSHPYMVDLNLHDYFEYKVGTQIESDFDTDINKICTNGIHFFLSKEGVKNYTSWLNLMNDTYMMINGFMFHYK